MDCGKKIGKYNLVKVVGRGAFGVAILVRDDTGNQFVAKQIDISRLSSSELQEVYNEMNVLSLVGCHPYIVTYQESIIDDKRENFYIVMDYCPGGELQKVVRDRAVTGRPFSEAQLKRWLVQLSLSLSFLHKQNILHRDLKTANIFVDSDKRLRLGDFGLGKALENTIAAAKTFCGTPGYMAPELCQSTAYSSPADIWALGCVMYELCSFKLPFHGNSLMEICQKVVKNPTPSFPSNYSLEFRNICSSMLCKDPLKRPSAEEILKTSCAQAELRLMAAEKTG